MSGFQAGAPRPWGPFAAARSVQEQLPMLTRRASRGRGLAVGPVSTPEGVSSALVCLDPARQATGFRAHRSERWRSLRCGVDGAGSCHSAGAAWRPLGPSSWGALGGPAGFSPEPGAWGLGLEPQPRSARSVSRPHPWGILREPERKRATAPGTCGVAWGRGSRPASGTGARGG